MVFGSRCLIVVCMCISLACASCGSAVKDPNRKPVVKVSGKVLLDGKPVKGIGVEFHPIQPDKMALVESKGITDATGAFQMMTYATGDGAPKGDYVVTFEMTDGRLAPDKLKNLYNNPLESQFKVTVSDKPVKLEPYDLKVEGIPEKPSTKVLSLKDQKKLKARGAKTP